MTRLEWVIGMRYALVGRGDRFVSFSSMASAIGVSLGVAAIIVVISVMNGFHINLRERLLSVTAHVEIHSLGKYRLSEEAAQDLLEQAVDDARVLVAAPTIDRQALLTSTGNARGVLVKGIDPEIEQKLKDIDVDTSLDALSAGSFKVLLGKGMARNLGVKIGDKVLLVSPQGAHTLGGVLPRLKTVEVAGIVSFGIYDLNDSLAYMHIDDARTMFRVAGFDTIRLRIDDVTGAPQLAEDLRNRLRINGVEEQLSVLDWTSRNATFFNALAVERRVMFVILSLIIAVAAFQIVAALVTMVRSKRGAIAILRTIGMEPLAVMRIFLIQGMLVGLTGTVVGVLIGLALAFNVNPIVTFVEGLFGIDFFPGEVYFLETIPSRVVPIDVLATAALAFFLTLLATIVPSMTAALIEPAEVLRHE